MKILKILGIALVIIFFTSCSKTNDNTQTKIGFYLDDKNTTSNEQTPYQLYIDNVYKGEIYALNYEPTDSDSKVLFETLDSKRHDVELKNKNGEYLSSGYLQIGKNCSKSGTSGKNCSKVEGINGASFSKKTANNYALYSFMKNK